MKRKSLRWSAAMVCFVTLLALSQVATTRAAGTAYQIRSTWTNFCLDVPYFGRPPQSHDRLQIFQCSHGGINQLFLFRGDGSIRLQWDPNMCLDVPYYGRPPQSQDPIQIYPCNGGSNQQFFLPRDGTIRLLGNRDLCFDVPFYGRPPQNQDLMQIYQCNGGLNQLWTLIAYPV